MAKDEYRIATDSPASKDLMFWTLVGHEALSQPSTYELCVLSERDEIPAKDILGHAFDVVLSFEDADGNAHERHCQGHAVRFARRGMAGRYFEYTITLRSWFWLLSKRLNSRIHQGQTVLQVMDAVIEDGPIRRLKKVETDGVIGDHKKRPYCVQHQESDFQFISRLLEEEGIYYWFDSHDAPGTMHLADASDLAHQPLPAAESISSAPSGSSEPRFNELRKFIDAALYDSGKYSSRDSDFKAIRKALSGSSANAAEHELSDLEVFEFPGGFFREADTDQAAKVRMEELSARRKLYWAITPWPDVAVGRRTRFHTVHTADDVDTEQLIVSCLFVASHPGYEGVDVSMVDDLMPALLRLLEGDRLNESHLPELEQIIRHAQGFGNLGHGMREFLTTSVPLATVFRPPRITPRVRMPGPQTAIVVGPAGKEIHADEHGRVKVHFHWDRYDDSDEKSTCWVRVSQPWAGKGWGGYFIPRIGQEVIVDFLNGDPDRPVIMGRVYNDDQPIPFTSHTQSGFRTRSTPKGTTSNFNEFRFEDQKGAEQVYLHAERNLDIEVEANETRNVGHNRFKTVGHDEKVTIKNNRTEDVTGNEKIDIHGQRDLTVDKDQYVQIKANHSEQVTGWKSTWIDGNHRINTKADAFLEVGVNETIKVGGTREDTVSGAVTESYGPLKQTVAGAVTVSSSGPVTFNAAGGFNVIAPGGTKIIDFEFSKFGGKITEGYAMQYNLNIMNIAMNAVRLQNNGINMAINQIKFDTNNLKVDDTNLIMKSSAVDLKSGGIHTVMKKLTIFL